MESVATASPQISEPSSSSIECRRIGDELTFTWAKHLLTVSLSRVRERTDGLHCEILITHELAGRVYWGHVSLASTSARERIVAKLKRDIGGDGGPVNWGWFVDELCFRAAREFRNDGAFVEVGAMEETDEGDEFLVSPLLLAGELNMIFGPSGTGKGYLAAALALQVGTGLRVLPFDTPATIAPVLYLDWEWSARELDQRLKAICQGVGVSNRTLLHKRMAGALADQAGTLRNEILRQNIKFLIVDSAQIACGENDGGDPAASWNRLTTAVRTFEVTTLLIDHPSKGAERGDETPYGTRYKLALCRNIWRARKSHGDQKQLHLGLWWDPNSNTPEHPPLGLRLTFDRGSWPNGRLRSLAFSREDVRDVEGFSDLLTDWQRIERLLAQAPLLTKDIAEGIGKAEATVRARLNERKEQVIRLPDKRWALLDRKHQA